MAISKTHAELLVELHGKGLLPQGGLVLEIGKANWYGDCDPASFGLSGDEYSVVRKFYERLFSPSDVAAIDLGSVDAYQYDLNTFTAPEGERRTCAAIINHGTAEHIFNIANVFTLMHDACEVGGLMIHEGPFTGWTDHGFYNLQPTLFWDVARVNGYEVVKVAIEHLASRSIIHVESREQILELRRRDQLPDNAMLWVAMRKTRDAPFVVPIQGVYSGQVSTEATEAWKQLR